MCSCISCGVKSQFYGINYRLYDETEGSTGVGPGFRYPRKPIYINTCVKSKGVHGFQGDLNPVGPEGFIL